MPEHAAPRVHEDRPAPRVELERARVLDGPFVSKDSLGRGGAPRFRGQARHGAPRRHQIEGAEGRRHHGQHGGGHHRARPPSGAAPGADARAPPPPPRRRKRSGPPEAEARTTAGGRGLRAGQLLPRVDVGGGEDRAHEGAAVARGDPARAPPRGERRARDAPRAGRRPPWGPRSTSGRRAAQPPDTRAARSAAA